MVVILIKYTKSLVSITPRGMASKCSPMDRYVKKAAKKPELNNSAINSKRNWNQIPIAKDRKKATTVFEVNDDANIPMLI